MKTGYEYIDSCSKKMELWTIAACQSDNHLSDPLLDSFSTCLVASQKTFCQPPAMHPVTGVSTTVTVCFVLQSLYVLVFRLVPAALVYITSDFNRLLVLLIFCLH